MYFVYLTLFHTFHYFLSSPMNIQMKSRLDFYSNSLLEVIFVFAIVYFVASLLC